MQHILIYTWHRFLHKYGECAYSLSHVLLFETPWTVAHQAPLSMGILQARTLEWVAIHSLLQRFSLPRDRTQVSCISGRFFLPSEPPWKLNMVAYCTNKIPL